MGGIYIFVLSCIYHKKTDSIFLVREKTLFLKNKL